MTSIHLHFHIYYRLKHQIMILVFWNFLLITNEMVTLFYFLQNFMKIKITASKTVWANFSCSTRGLHVLKIRQKIAKRGGGNREPGERATTKNVVVGTCRHVCLDHLEDNFGAFLVHPWDRAKLARVPVLAADEQLQDGTLNGTRKQQTREKHPNELPTRTWRSWRGNDSSRPFDFSSRSKGMLKRSWVKDQSSVIFLTKKY